MENGSLSAETTADGSVTFRSERFGETFHNRQGAWQEALSKFVEPTHLRAIAAQSTQIRLLDICYGLGYNTAAALATIWAVNPDCRVEWVGLELDPIAPQAALPYLLAALRLFGQAQGLGPGLGPGLVAAIAQILTDLAQTGQARATGAAFTGDFAGRLHWGDARQTLPIALASGFQADAIFLDPFSPHRCPQLWTVEFLGLAAQGLQPEGRLVTYSCAAAVRSALLAAGLQVGATAPFGRFWPGTVASFSAIDLPPLSAQELEHLQTKAAVPYRDPKLTNPAQVILDRKHQEQATSPLEPTSRWKRRWLGDCRAKWPAVAE
ncbi:MAG: hypothetical protein EA001_15485 [Oscillatoriales cyanobacterium]|nr:MAG: hypothetical protein EA001_15485 [Oscillatoriales cyanobacterium]